MELPSHVQVSLNKAFWKYSYIVHEEPSLAFQFQEYILQVVRMGSTAIAIIIIVIIITQRRL